MVGASQNAQWKSKAFKIVFNWTEGGEEARSDLRLFIWNGLSAEQREEWVGTAVFGSTRHNLLFDSIVKSLRGKVVIKRAHGGELGQPNAFNPRGEGYKKKIKKYLESDHGQATQQAYHQSEEGKKTRKAYRTTDSGKQSVRKYATSDKGKQSVRKYATSDKRKQARKAYLTTDKQKQARARRREEHYQKRANQEFDEMDGTAGDVADDLLGTHYEELEYETTAGWQERIGPGQYFVCGAPTERERRVESIAILLNANRGYPAIMKNPVGYPVWYPLEGRVVDQGEVEMLGLERFTEEELEGWDYINLLELDLTGREDSRPIYAVEQQLQHKTEWQDLGYQRLNRVAGAGPWGNKPRGTVMVGFAYAPRGWLEAHYHEIAIVRGKKRGGAPDGTNVDLTGLAGSKLRTTGMLPPMGKKTSL